MRMKKKQNNCKCCQVVKRCVFKVRNTGKQETLQPKALLSKHTLQIMLNNGSERPFPLNVKAYPRTFDATKPSFSYQVDENITVH